jgi:hypothetical protein
MARLLAKRKRLDITRRQFLARWRKLRRELALTDEYRETRRAVRERAFGMCERCGDNGTTMHHCEQVSFAPQHALDPDRCEWVCHECHRSEHPWLR